MKQASTSVAAVAQAAGSVSFPLQILLLLLVCLIPCLVLGSLSLQPLTYFLLINICFLSIESSNMLPSIIGADGSKASPTGIGQANPLPSLSLSSVLHVPCCPYGLISVSCLTKSLDCRVIFDSILFWCRIEILDE